MTRYIMIVNGFWRRRFINVFSLFRNYLPLERKPFNWQFESTSPKDSLCQVWLKLSQWFWGRRFFLISSMYFPYFVIISPWKRVGTFIWTNLNSHHPRILCVKYGWNRPSGSGEGDENVKSLRPRQRQRRQRRQRRTNFDQKSSLEPSAQVS